MTAKGTNLPTTQVFKESHALTEKQMKKISNYTHVYTREKNHESEGWQIGY